MGTYSMDLNNICLDSNFDEDNPNTIIFIRLLAERIKFEKHSKRWWDFACQKMRKKKKNQFLLSNAFNVYKLRLLIHFDT